MIIVSPQSQLDLDLALGMGLGLRGPDLGLWLDNIHPVLSQFQKKFTFVSRQESVLGFPCPLNVGPSKSRKKLRFDETISSRAPVPHVATFPDLEDEDLWGDNLDLLDS